MKVKKSEIKTITVTSGSPLVVEIVLKSGGSSSYSYEQLWTELTDGARNDVQRVIDKRGGRPTEPDPKVQVSVSFRRKEMERLKVLARAEGLGVSAFLHKVMTHHFDKTKSR